jgi:hypothetical protein
MSNIVTAVFISRSSAEAALIELREKGVPDGSISIIAQESTPSPTAEAVEAAEAIGGDHTLKGVGIGAGVGALFGLTALLIPGIGPFVAAGAITQAMGVTLGSAVTGAVIGAAAGGMTGALTAYGLSEAAARAYADEVARGGIFIGVGTAEVPLPDWEIEEVLTRHGGRTAGDLGGASNG